MILILQYQLKMMGIKIYLKELKFFLIKLLDVSLYGKFVTDIHGVLLFIRKLIFHLKLFPKNIIQLVLQRFNI